MPNNNPIQAMYDQFWKNAIEAVESADVDGIYQAAIDLKAFQMAVKSFNDMAPNVPTL